MERMPGGKGSGSKTMVVVGGEEIRERCWALQGQVGVGEAEI